MSRRRAVDAPVATGRSGARPDTVVLLCRGCCCGTAGKHPDVDHEDQRHRLEAAAAEQPGVEVRVVECLDACERSNVAVVRRLSQPATSRDTWLGGLLTARATGQLADWVSHGADGSLPPAVAGLVFRPARRRR